MGDPEVLRQVEHAILAGLNNAMSTISITVAEFGRGSEQIAQAATDLAIACGSQNTEADKLTVLVESMILMLEVANGSGCGSGYEHNEPCRLDPLWSRLLTNININLEVARGRSRMYKCINDILGQTYPVNMLMSSIILVVKKVVNLVGF